MTALSDDISKYGILLPKVIGPLAAGILAALIAYRHMAVPNAMDAIIAGLTLMVPLLGGGLSALATASKSNPANVASTGAVISSAPGQADVTSKPE